MEINIGETHIRLTTDIAHHNLKGHIVELRSDLKTYISHNPDFRISYGPIKVEDDDMPPIVEMMHESSNLSDVGPMACVAGTISQLSLEYLTSLGSRDSIVENGGDIALINSRTVLCGIYSNNDILGNDIAFRIRPRKNGLGICTSSGKIGHSVSFGSSDSVTVIASSASLADGLATRIANEVKGQKSEDRVVNASEIAENYRQHFDGVLIICDENVATVGRLPRIVETCEFDFNI